MVVRVRNGAIDAIKSTSALSLIPSSLRAALRWRLLVCSCNLNCHCELLRTLTSENRKHFRNHLTAKFAKRRLFYKFQLFNRSTCSTERQGNKRSAAADLIASIALRRIRRTQARLPSKPPYKSQNPKGGFGALWHAFLLYLSSCNERWSPRRA